MAVVYLSRNLADFNPPVCPPSITLTAFLDNPCVDSWLNLRREAFIGLKPSPGDWTVADFERQFSNQSWWRPDWMWLAVCKDTTENGRVVGSVGLAVRDTSKGQRAAAHWLAVLPKWRGRGIGRFLMAKLEQTAREAGHNRVEVETHSNWTEAVAFYKKLGYR